MALRACRNKTWKPHVFRTFCELTGVFLYNNLRMVFLEGILLVQGKPVTQPVHFFQCHLAELIRGVRPVKSITVKAFHKDPESGSVPLENLDEGAPAVAECKHAARVWVELEFKFDDGRQTIVAFSEICCPAGKVYRCAACQVKHSLLTSLSAPGIIPEDRMVPPRSGCIPK